MAEKVGEIYFVVEAHTQKVLDSLRPTNASIDELSKNFGGAESAGRQFEFQMKKTSAEIKRLGDKGDLAANQLKALRKLLGGILAVQTAKGVLELVEGYNEMADRVQIATSSLEEYEFVQSRMLRIANATERDMKEAQELYLGTADALKEMGYTTEQVIDIGDSLSHSFAANAASAEVADSAIKALSKAMVTGKVSAQQWISIEAAAPNIIADIAKASGKTTAEIRRMGADGKVSAKMLSDGLLDARDKNQELDEAMSQTVAGSMKRIINSFAAYAGELNRSTGATQVITGAMSAFAENIDGVATAIGITVSAALGRYVALTGQSILATANAAAASRNKAEQSMIEAASALRAADADVAKVSAALAVAEADVAAATAALNKAKANITLTSSSASLVAAEERLKIAEQNLARQRAITTDATNRQTSANTALSASKQAVATAGSRLLGILGGPLGLGAMILSAGAAILTMSRNARDAKPQIDFLALSIKDLTNETLALTKVDLIRYIKELGGLGTEASKASAQIETLQARLKEAPGSPMADSWRREIEKLSAVVDIAQSQMKPYEKLLEQITKLEEERKNQTKEGYRDPEADRILADKRKELELIKLEGEARARLKAIYDLGDNATEPQKKEAAELAAQIYRIEEARKKAAAANKKGLKESEQAAKENKKAVADLSEELRLATLEGKALAEAQALSKLNKFATPDDIARVKALAGAIYELELAEQNRQMLADMDPVEAERQRFEEQLGSLKRLHEAKLLEDQRYYDLKEGLEREHNDRMRQAEEERFAAQSWQNEMVIKGLNNLEQATASAMTGLLSGASNSTQAIQALAAGISQELIGSIVKMGFEQVKAWAMGQVAQKAAAAGYVASVAGQVKANTALAAQAAFTSIAAIPITGPAMAPAAAAAAAATSASLGAPAIAAAATSYGGGRQYGGPASAGKMYRINEDGRPEVFNAANGQQYLLPNTRGQVVSNKDAAAGGSNINVSVTVHSNGEITSDIGALTGMGQDIGRAVQAIVKRELNMAMQPGGVIRSRGY